MSETELSTEERLARALLTLAEVESCVTKVENYLASNGKYLDLDARVPMERQTEAMREALNRWKAPAPAGDTPNRMARPIFADLIRAALHPDPTEQPEQDDGGEGA